MGTPKEGNHPPSQARETTITDDLDYFSFLPPFVVTPFLVSDYKESGVLL